MRTAITRSEKGFKQRECIQMSTLRPVKFARNLRRHGEHGAQLVEMALLLPVLLSLLFGAFWAARAYNIYETITRAAREGARVAVAPSCSACGNAVPSVANVENAVLNSLSASSINTSNIQLPASCSGNLSSIICYQRDIALNTSTPKELGVSVSFTYPFPVTLPFISLSLSTINIQTAVQMREEN
jgi:Flp pilus assembly protein TadG